VTWFEIWYKVAERPRPLAVQPADRQVDLLQRPEHLVDLLGQAERRQVQHDAGPHPGADVRRARGQVPELGVERVRQPLLQRVVEPVDVAPRLVEGEPAAEHLQAEVVLLVDHDAGRLGRVERHPARALQPGRQLAADELPLDQELAVERGQRRNVGVLQPVPGVGLGDRLLRPGDHLRLVGRGGPGGERQLGQVAGQPDARGHHHVRLRAGAAEPLAQVREQVVELHRAFRVFGVWCFGRRSRAGNRTPATKH
jgi:hypothetical protein